MGAFLEESEGRRWGQREGEGPCQVSAAACPPCLLSTRRQMQQPRSVFQRVPKTSENKLVRQTVPDLRVVLLWKV